MVLTKNRHTREGNESAAFLFKRHEPTYHLDMCNFVRLLITRLLYYKVLQGAQKGLNSESSALAVRLFVSPRYRHCCTCVVWRPDAVRGRLPELSWKFGTVKIQGQSCQLTCSLENLHEGQMPNNTKMWTQVLLECGPHVFAMPMSSSTSRAVHNLEIVPVCVYCFSCNRAIALTPPRAHDKGSNQSGWMGGREWAWLWSTALVQSAWGNGQRKGTVHESATQAQDIRSDLKIVQWSPPTQT